MPKTKLKPNPELEDLFDKLDSVNSDLGCEIENALSNAETCTDELKDEINTQVWQAGDVARETVLEMIEDKIAELEEMQDEAAESGVGEDQGRAIAVLCELQKEIKDWNEEELEASIRKK